MAVTMAVAKKLCSASELQIVATSLREDNRGLSADRVKKKIDLVRKLRDKFRAESKRQRREARGKSDPRGRTPAQSNDNTVIKAQLFDETLTRYQDKLKQLSAPASKPASKKVVAKSAKKVTTAKKTSGKQKVDNANILSKITTSRAERRKAKSSKSKIGREANRMAGTGLQKIAGHVKGQTRRNQARRDSR